MLNPKLSKKSPKKIKPITYYVFGLTGCPYYENAIKLIETNKVSYKTFTFQRNDPSWKTTLKQLHSKIGNHSTSPVIFKNNIFIGGYDDLKLKLKI
jgi:glutaredoxin